MSATRIEDATDQPGIAGPHRYDPFNCGACMNSPELADQEGDVEHTNWDAAGRLVASGDIPRRDDLDLEWFKNQLIAQGEDASRTLRAIEDKEASGELDEADVAVRSARQNIVDLASSALARIELGAFGLCVTCNESIDEQRLRMMPTVDQCLDCRMNKSKKREAEEVERNEAELSEAAVPVQSPSAEVTPDEPERDNGTVEGAGTDIGIAGDLGEIDDGSASIDNQSQEVATAPDGHPSSESASPEDQAEDVEGAGAVVGPQFGDRALPSVTRGEDVRSLPVAKILPDPNNPRSKVGDVSDLATSIGSIGLLQPLVVRPNGDDTYTIVVGHRRFAAVKAIGWDLVPVEVRLFTPKEGEEAMLIENLQREDLAPLEEARGYKRLVDNHGMTTRAIADRVGVSQSHVSKRMALLALPDGAVEALQKPADSGGITLEDAQTLLKLKDHPKKLTEAWEEFEKDDPDYRSLEGVVEEQLFEVETEEKAKAARAKFKEQGVKVVTPDASGELDGKKVVPIGKRERQLDVDRKAHAKEPCHAAEVDKHSGVGRLVCTDPDRHKKRGGESALKGKVLTFQDVYGGSRGPAAKKTPEQKRKENFVQLMNDETERRRSFIAELLGSQLLVDREGALKEAARLHLVMCVGDGHYYTNNAETMELLRVEKKARKASTLSNLAFRDEESGIKVLLAVAASGFESSLSISAYNATYYRSWAEAKPYFDWLVAHGYEMSDYETAQLRDKDGAWKRFLKDVAKNDDADATAAKKKTTAPKKATAKKVTARRSSSRRSSTKKEAKTA